ncbi:MAG: oxidoreductase [Gammaproteobacteria bacterium]|nr:oxidoreductase [Gammaproteobacteria bacterium]
MILSNVVRAGFYLDSVALMRISATLSDDAGVDECVLMMGTPANKRVMADAGLLNGEGNAAGPDDLVIAIRAHDNALIEAALQRAEDALSHGAGRGGDAIVWRPQSVRGALETLPDANLALISVAAQYAVGEAMRALSLGLNVMIFSDNISLEDELLLKRYALERDLLLMGPDCGTAYVGGVPLAFAHAVRPGNVGVISASGTGLQVLSVLVDQAGGGLSSGFGVGGRDLDDRIGGLSTQAALELLLDDDKTQRVVLISKPPGPETARTIFQRMANAAKPCGVFALGIEPSSIPDGVVQFGTLKAAAEWSSGESCGWTDSEIDEMATRCRSKHAVADQPRISGVFAGGTLCLEAHAILKTLGLDVDSNTSLGTGAESVAATHRLLDLGADEYTVGRPHPMLEPRTRDDATRSALASADIVLVDFLLGYGSADDPTSAFLKCLGECQEAPLVVACLVGTPGDPQGLSDHRRQLEAHGVVVAPTSSDAAMLAGKLAAGA